MASWQIQHAKAHFSELLNDAEQKGPQIITRHGAERAVVLSIQEYRTLKTTRPDDLTALRTNYVDFRDWLLNGPKLDDNDPFFAALERDPNDTGRDIDL